MAVSRRVALSEGTPFFEENSDITDPDNFVELISFVVPGGLTRKLTKVEVACRIEGIYEILENTETIGSGRTGAAQPTNSFVWDPARPVATGSTIKVRFKSRAGSAVSDVEAYLMASDFT